MKTIFRGWCWAIIIHIYFVSPYWGQAQDIIAFNNGYLTFTNSNTSLYYSVQWIPDLIGTDTWSESYQQMKNIRSSNATVSVPVGVHYRVIGRTNAAFTYGGNATPSDILAGRIAYVNDAEISGNMPFKPGNVTAVSYENVGSSLRFRPSAGYYPGDSGNRIQASDADFVAGNIKSGIVVFGLEGSYEASSAISLPITGQTTVYLTGDNGTHQTGTDWPTPRFSDNGNGTVTDHMTGLMWPMNAQSASGWGTDPQGNPIFYPGTMSWSNAINYCNNYEIGGHSDWRLPNVLELLSIIHWGESSPALPPGHLFTNVPTSNVDYWSSTSSDENPTLRAWCIGINYGHVIADRKDDIQYIWPVRTVP